MRSNIQTLTECSLPERIPFPADAHQHLIAGAHDFLDHALGEVTPQMIAFLGVKLSELAADLAVLSSQIIT